MITAGDIRWCTKDAFFSIMETNIAMTADVGTFPRLQRYIPEGWVKQMAYTGMRLPAAKAKEIGIDYVQGWHVRKPAPLADFLKAGLESVKLPEG